MAVQSLILRVLQDLRRAWLERKKRGAALFVCRTVVSFDTAGLEAREHLRVTNVETGPPSYHHHRAV
jgi:hypothetical protein